MAAVGAGQQEADRQGWQKGLHVLGKWAVLVCRGPLPGSWPGAACPTLPSLHPCLAAADPLVVAHCMWAAKGSTIYHKHGAQHLRS